jgi:hypothetical protein
MKSVARWVGNVEGIGAMRSAYNILVGKLERRDQSEDVGRRREDTIIMNLREIEWEDVDWVHLTQDRDRLQAVVNTIMNLGVP